MAKKTIAEAAAEYGLTVEQFRAAQMQFLQSEGFHDDGHESETLHDWLTYRRRQEPREPADPFDVPGAE